MTNDEIEQYRQIRNGWLSWSDWTQNSDSPLTEEKKTEWAVWRQEIRDILQGIDEYSDYIDPIPPTPDGSILPMPIITTNLKSSLLRRPN